MEHLTKAMEKMAKNAGTTLSRSYLKDVNNYVITGDKKLLRGLLKLDDARMNSLCQLARAFARPDKWGDGELRLIEFFVRRCDLFNGQDKGDPMGRCSDWPLPNCL